MSFIGNLIWFLLGGFILGLGWECAIRGKNSRQKIENVSSQIIQWLEESNDPVLEIKG